MRAAFGSDVFETAVGCARLKALLALRQLPPQPLYAESCSRVARRAVPSRAALAELQSSSAAGKRSRAAGSAGDRSGGDGAGLDAELLSYVEGTEVMKPLDILSPSIHTSAPLFTPLFTPSPHR